MMYWTLGADTAIQGLVINMPLTQHIQHYGARQSIIYAPIITDYYSVVD
jgi:hypothetical protein